MYPIEYTWIRKPTPVTIIAIVAESGSQRRSTPRTSFPIVAHVKRWTWRERPPLGTESRYWSEIAEATNATAIADEPNSPDERPIRRPAHRSSTAPASGAARMRGVRFTPLPPQEIQIV